MEDISNILRTGPIIAVLTLEDAAAARALAETYVRAGVRTLEVTLRTPQALDVIAEMAKVDGAIVGAGTVLTRDQLQAAQAHGATFAVSPGLTATLVTAAAEAGVAYLPGVANASDIMRGLELGLTHFKFFPAEAAGGMRALDSLAAPFAQCHFCPTGGVNAANLRSWLDTPGVLCAGGTWLNPRAGETLASIGVRAAEAMAAAGR